MKIKFDKKYIYWGVTAFLVIAASILFYYFLFHTSSIKKSIVGAMKICMPIIDGLIFAYLLTPLVNAVERRVLYPWFKIPTQSELNEYSKQKKICRFVSVLVTMAFVILLIVFFIALVIPQLVSSIQNIALSFPQYASNLQELITKYMTVDSKLETTSSTILTQYSTEFEKLLNGKVLPQINEWVSKSSAALFSSILNVLVALWNIIIGLIISVYILGSKEKFTAQSKKTLYAIFPKDNANIIIRVFRFANYTFGGYISGKLLDSLIIGLLCFIGVTILGLPYTILISVIIGVTNIIPFFGPYLGAIPSFILILMVNPLQSLYFLIFILILQQFDGNFLGPKILGNKTGISGFWVIFSITVFGGLFGIWGMAIGVPIFAIIYTGIKKVLNQSLVKKNLSTKSTDYMNLSEIRDNEYIELMPPQERKKAFMDSVNKSPKVNKINTSHKNEKKSNQTEKSNNR